MLRAGIPTASELNALVTPKFAIKKGEGTKTYLAEKVAEAWQGGPLPTFQGYDMETGALQESEARTWFEFAHDAEIKRVGFITTDDGRAGCSPDGLLSDDCGLEIKCPKAETQTRYLLAGVLPEEYEHQVHGCMFVTGFNQWKFISYRRNFPALVLTIERDEAKIAIIREALEMFAAEFDKAMKRMEEINGGPQHSRLNPKPLPTIQPITTKLAEALKPLNLTYLQ